MKRAAAALFLVVTASIAMAQFAPDNVVRVKQFQGGDVGHMVTNAMSTCGTNTLIPCYLLLDPSLAVYPAGTMPTLCSHCFLLDWRTGPPGGGFSGTGSPPNVALWTAANGLGSASFLNASTQSTLQGCTDPVNGFNLTTIALCANYDEGSSDPSTGTTSRALLGVQYRSNQGGLYTYNGTTGVKSNRSIIGGTAAFRTMAQNWGIDLDTFAYSGGESIGYGLLQTSVAGYVGPGQETHEGVRIQQSQNDDIPSDGLGGIWAATASSVNSGTGVVSFGTPTSGSSTLGEGRLIRDLSTKVTGTYTNITCTGSPYTCTVTGTGFSALAGYATNPHTTWNSGTPGNPILTSNVAFCAAPAANDGFDHCVPVTAISGDTSLTLNLQSVGTQGSSTGWTWPVSGSYALYRTAYPIAVDTVGNTFTASDVSGIGNGHSLDQVMAYNGDFTGVQIYQQRSIGRNGYGGGVQIYDWSSTNAPSFAFGFQAAGAYGHAYNAYCNGTRCPASFGSSAGWDPSAGFSFFDDLYSSTASDCIWGDSFSDAIRRCAIGVDKNVADSDSWYFANSGLSVDLHGNGSFIGALASLNGGFGPYDNEAYDSLLQHGSTYYTASGVAWASSTANSATDPWNGTTGTTYVSGSSLSQTGGVYSKETQTTNITTTIGQSYACSIWAYSTDSNVYFVTSMQGATFSSLVQGGASVVPGVSTGLSTVPTKYTTYGVASSAAALQFTFSTYTPSIHVMVSQVQCQKGSVTGIQVITNTAAVSGNGLVVNGTPQNTINGAGATSAGAAAYALLGSPANGTYGFNCSSGSCTPTAVGGTMTWPGAAGIANYGGSSAWGTSYSSGNPIPANFVTPPSASTITTGTLPHAQLPTLVSGDIPNNGANTTGSAASLSAASALPNSTTATTQSAGDNSIKVATDAYVDSSGVHTVVDTSSAVSVSSTLAAEVHFNENATAATAIIYTLPTAAAGKQFCFNNAYNGSAANTGTLEILTSATGQFIIFTDGTLSATGGYVISGGAAADGACVQGVDSTHWFLTTQRGTWTKH